MEEGNAMTATQLVREFCGLMVKRDPELLRPYLAETVVYQNTGMPAAVGIADVIANVAAQFAMFPDSYEYETINCVGNDEVVMNDRLHRVTGPDGAVHALPVMGTFIVHNSKITRWTDYWDSGLIAKMMSGAE